MEFFQEYKVIFNVLHLVGVALGVGGATVTDALFFKFLKDFRISGWEARVMSMVSDVIWVGLGLLYISGVGLFLSNPEVYMASSKFLTKMLIVLVITINGIVLNAFLTPRLKHITFHQRHDHHPGELHVLRKCAFASGAISITSWYIALILGALRSIPYSVSQGIGGYLLMLALAIIGSQALERFLDWQRQRH